MTFKRLQLEALEVRTVLSTLAQLDVVALPMSIEPTDQALVQVVAEVAEADSGQGPVIELEPAMVGPLFNEQATLEIEDTLEVPASIPEVGSEADWINKQSDYEVQAVNLVPTGWLNVAEVHARITESANNENVVDWWTKFIDRIEKAVDKAIDKINDDNGNQNDSPPDVNVVVDVKVPEITGKNGKYDNATDKNGGKNNTAGQNVERSETVMKVLLTPTRTPASTAQSIPSEAAEGQSLPSKPPFSAPTVASKEQNVANAELVILPQEAEQQLLSKLRVVESADAPRRPLEEGKTSVTEKDLPSLPAAKTPELKFVLLHAQELPGESYELFEAMPLTSVQPQMDVAVSRAGLDEAIQNFLDELDQMARDVGQSLTQAPTWAWMAAFGAGIGMVAHHGKQHRRKASTTAVAPPSSIPGLPPLSSLSC